MKAKYVFSLLAIILTTSVALAQQPAPPPTPPSEDFGNTFSFFVDGGGFLGVYGEDISNENMARYHLSQARGVGITQIIPDSPAEKAGLRKDDVILRIDDENVTSVRKLNRLVSEIAPDHSVRITISRNGSEQQLSATIGKRKNFSTAAAPELFRMNPRVFKWEGSPRVFKWEGPLMDGDKFPDIPDNSGDFGIILGNGRRIGVSTMELTKQLADYFGVTGGRGVLVTSVTEDGPAAKAGVKAGDVITAVDGEAVDSPGDVARAISRKKEGEVTLTVIRNRTQQTIRVTPRQGASTRVIRDEMARTIRDQIRASIRDQVGRQIVIPRIEFPEMNISTPRIEIPAIPPINIAIPRVRINPGVIRISRGVYGPI
jgi:serine protease Do